MTVVTINAKIDVRLDKPDLYELVNSLEDEMPADMTKEVMLRYIDDLTDEDLDTIVNQTIREFLSDSLGDRWSAAASTYLRNRLKEELYNCQNPDTDTRAPPLSGTEHQAEGVQ